MTATVCGDEQKLLTEEDGVAQPAAWRRERRWRAVGLLVVATFAMAAVCALAAAGRHQAVLGPEMGDGSPVLGFYRSDRHHHHDHHHDNHHGHPTPHDDLGVSPYLYAPLPLSVASGEARGLQSTPPALFVLSAGSVVTFAGDVTVNAANPRCLIGHGLDGAIAKAGGEELAQARLKLPELDSFGTRCPTGDAKLTISGQLPSKWCVQAVGPDYRNITWGGGNLQEGDKLLRSAYLDSMRRAQETGAGTIALPLLSAGIYRGSRTLAEVLEVGVRAIEDGSYPELREVHLVAYTTKERHTLEQVARRVCAKRGAHPKKP